MNLPQNKKAILWQKLNDGSTDFIIFGYVICIIYAILILIPWYFVLVSSFKTTTDILNHPLSLPREFSFENYTLVQKIARLDRAALISAEVTLGSEVLTLLLGFPAAFAIARFRTKLSGIAEAIFSLGFLIPALAMLVPVFLNVVRMGLLYDPFALIFFYPATKLSVTIIILASYLRTVPFELEESAEMDGATRLEMIWHIFIPLSKPAIITVVVLNFIDFWNEYLFSLVLMSQENRTLQIALTSLRSARMIDYGTISAGVVLVLIPIFIVFVVFQEQIMNGIYSGAIKG